MINEGITNNAGAGAASAGENACFGFAGFEEHKKVKPKLIQINDVDCYGRSSGSGIVVEGLYHRPTLPRYVIIKI